MKQFTAMLSTIDGYVWGIPMLVLIIGTGLLLTVRTGALQFCKLGKALKYMVHNEEGGEGEVSSFAALTTALAATVGTGNIVGVATAICTGGPGALFWMEVAACVGMATKYSEGLLAVKYRVLDENGRALGGPFYYIERGLGPNWKWLAKLFAFFGAAAGILGIGTITQVNSITSAVGRVFDPESKHIAFSIGDHSYTWTTTIAAIVVTALVALVVIGGIQRISSVASLVVPAMMVLYAAAAAQTKEPVRQGLVSMTGTFLDTIVICTMTGLTIVLTGSHNVGLEGVDVTIRAFGQGLPWSETVGAILLMVCLAVFAFTTTLGWDYYGERCLEYFTNKNMKAVKAYRYLYILAVLIGPFLTLEFVWTFADIFNGLMAFPNLVGLLGLSGVVAAETRSYFKRLNAGEVDEGEKFRKKQKNAA